ncbi:MAG: hypothetical protein IKD99_04355 [Erysipelotrichaceae bacterium]|nr:hypothetical protein [Erysipelotrichaceae bacterium]
MKSSKAAIIIMLVAILGSSTVSAVTSMNSMAAKVTNYFYNGDGQYTNQSIYKDIVDKTEIATNLVSLSKNYVSGNDAHIKAINSRINDISSEKSVSKLYKLNQTLDTNVDWLLETLKNSVGILGRDYDLYVKYMSNYRSEVMTINSSDYNTKVREYDKETKGFPGSLFRVFVKNAEYFE